MARALAGPTLVGVSAARADVDLPGLLPAMLVPDRAGPATRRTTRDWIVDWTLFALAAVGGLAVFFEDFNRNHPPEALVMLDLLLGAVGIGALWVRRRWPMGVALALVPVGFVSTVGSVATVIALFTVAVHRPAGSVAIIAGLQMAGVPLFQLLHPEDDLPFWAVMVLSLLLTVLVVAWGMFVRARRQLVLSLRERTLRAEREQKLRVEQARQQERTRIAREMHDVLAHRISLLSLHAGALEFRPDAPPEEVARAAGVIRETAHEALEELRQVIGVLRGADDRLGPEAPERPQPTLAALPQLLDESQAAGTRVRLRCLVGDLAAVPGATGRNAYRIVQEGLTNARKHAHGATVDLVLDGAPGDGLHLRIVNPMPVALPAGAAIPGAGTGIVGLAERAALAGGRLEHGRTPEGDFELAAWLPWPA
jgi:signal transduction histidine kinase